MDCDRPREHAPRLRIRFFGADDDECDPLGHSDDFGSGAYEHDDDGELCWCCCMDEQPRRKSFTTHPIPGPCQIVVLTHLPSLQYTSGDKLTYKWVYIYFHRREG